MGSDSPSSPLSQSCGKLTFWVGFKRKFCPSTPDPPVNLQETHLRHCKTTSCENQKRQTFAHDIRKAGCMYKRNTDLRCVENLGRGVRGVVQEKVTLSETTNSKSPYYIGKTPKETSSEQILRNFKGLLLLVSGRVTIWLDMSE